MLSGVLFVSSSTQLITSEQFGQRMIPEIARNIERDLTGVLLHDDGNFMEYLEGPKDAVQHTFKEICSAGLHKGVMQMVNKPLEKREFGLWPLACWTSGSSKQLCSPPFYPDKALDPDSRSSVTIALRSFWSQAVRRRRYEFLSESLETLGTGRSGGCN